MIMSGRISKVILPASMDDDTEPPIAEGKGQLHLPVSRRVRSRTGQSAGTYHIHHFGIQNLPIRNNSNEVLSKTKVFRYVLYVLFVFLTLSSALSRIWLSDEAPSRGNHWSRTSSGSASSSLTGSTREPMGWSQALDNWDDEQ